MREDLWVIEHFYQREASILLEDVLRDVGEFLRKLLELEFTRATWNCEVPDMTEKVGGSSLCSEVLVKV